MKSKGIGNKQITIGFVSLGCPKNTVDSEVMLARIGQAGFVLTGEMQADAVIINTCGFIEPAKQEALDVIRRAVKEKKKGRLSRIIVAGCLSQRMGAALLEEIPQIDAVVGLGQRDQIVEILRSVLQSPARQPATRQFLQPSSDVVFDDSERLLINPSHWAYLRISEGCSRQCSFCTIPDIRGKFRSKPLDLVLSEARQLAEHGVLELNLIAQDTTSYGRDIGLKNGLITLISELEKIEKVHWLRLMYLYPASVDEALINKIAQSTKVVHYVDIPIQHISNTILRAMHRPDTKENTLQLLQKLRQAIPDIVLRTTVIVGFPGETDKQFEELIDFIRWAQFDALGAFPYFAESGTKAADLPDQVPDSLKQERLSRLMLTQQEIAFRKADEMKGKELTVLVDEADQNGNLIGRFYGQAPHIDSVCLLQGPPVQPGRFIQARVVGREGYDLLVEPI
ncbi:MAG TPA: 30S ribosomal protein S12 methylthiotransferase RimO [Anaerohalosphaeraceae bacterium]|nr:30S ribosomal protein S12 methylthiotransferase RimO [Anaerohalosphaeraceae bacterium]HOL89854.1 30S ribosomal protein S12 methylthiotransferase RimO [Anaerohalosphaeraceae bacterium]HPP55901.1 30S ribosomal protein S12 methylthiotransferase RimO [Anaerohalosphaeraceae bacterium]